MAEYDWFDGEFHPFERFHQQHGDATGEKLLIAGSRSFGSADDATPDISFDGLDTLVANLAAEAEDVLGVDPDFIIHGGAAGIDLAAAQLAEQRDGVDELCCSVGPTKWNKLGKRAGPLRNGAMVTVADACFAIWDGKSSGTQWTIAAAREHLWDDRVAVAEYVGTGFEFHTGETLDTLAIRDDIETAVSDGKPFAGLPGYR